LKGGALPKPGKGPSGSSDGTLGVSTNNAGVPFSRPNWAMHMPGVQSSGSIGGADDPDDPDIPRRILVTYSDEAKAAMLADIEATDAYQANVFAAAGMTTSDFATATASNGAAPSKIEVNHQFDDLNVVVLTAPQSSLLWLMDNRPENFDFVEMDMVRQTHEVFEDFEESEEGVQHRMLLEQAHSQNAGRRELQQLTYENAPSDPNDPTNSQTLPYGIQMVESTDLWSLGITGSGVKVCVIDSGTYRASPDFKTSNLSGNDTPNVNGATSFWYEDLCRHGTHCAGTVAADNDKNGVVGVAYNAGVHSVKVFHGSGCGWSYASGLIGASNKCKEAGAKVISMSLGGGGSSTTESNHFQALFDNDGILTVAAAGNGGNTAKSYPASYPSIMSVAAVDKNSNKVGFSQWNDAVDIAAPGSGVLSVRSGDTTGDNNLNYSGTSMATPHVAGVAALLFSEFGNVSTDKKLVAEKIRMAIETTALDRGEPGRDDEYGHGIIKAKAAYDCLLTGPCSLGTTRAPTVSPAPSAPPTPAPPTAPPTPSPPCMDMFGDVDGGSPWVDADGLPYNCAWYASGSSNCANYGGGYANCGTDGNGDGTPDWTLPTGSCPTANTVCCACGGGVVPPVDGTDAPNVSPNPSAKPSASPSSSPVATPSASPSATPSAKPSASPTLPCVEGTMSVTLDSYGSETNWKVNEAATDTTMGQHSGSSGTTPLTCLNTDMYYHFAITDTWGDGMCCYFGEGSYDLQVNGLTVKSGGGFSASEEVMFKPTPQGSDVELKFMYSMDSWPLETQWDLTSSKDGLMGSQAYGTYRRGKRVVIEAAVDPANCYTLNVGDSWGDGLVDGAYWQVYWNGVLKYDFGTGRENGNFGNTVSVDIGNGCAGDILATDSSGVKTSVTMDSPSAYTLSHANSKEASIVQGDNDGDIDKEDDDKEDNKGARGGKATSRGGGNFVDGRKGFQGGN
jgi:subtilisin family serine protease